MKWQRLYWARDESRSHTKHTFTENHYSSIRTGSRAESRGGPSVFGVQIRVSIVDSSTVKDMACFGQMIHQSITASILCGQHHSRKQNAQLWSPEIHGYKYICVYIQTGTSKKKMNIMKTVNILYHSFQKVKPIYYIYSLHIEWNISSLHFLTFYDYGLEIMKTPNSVSQKIRILHKIK